MDNYAVQNLTSEAWSSKDDRIVYADAVPYAQKVYFNRYFFALEKACKGYWRKNTDLPYILIDIACGDGAGTAFLAEQIESWVVIGVDIDEDIIEHADKNYNRQGLSYIVGGLDQFNPGKADIITCLETLEHVTTETMHRFLKSAKESLYPGGKLVVSMPRLRPRESTKKRPGHINELFYDQFKYVLGGYFNMLEFWSMDRYGNVIPDTPDCNLMLAVCTKRPETKIFI